jgi:hypothetical protein
MECSTQNQPGITQAAKLPPPFALHLPPLKTLTMTMDPSGEGREWRGGVIRYLSYYQVSRPDFSYLFQFLVQEIIKVLFHQFLLKRR